MSRYVLPLSACLLLSLGGCATTDETASTETAPATTADAMASTSPTPASTDTSTSATTTSNSAMSCDAEAARSVVGQTASADLVEQARSAAGAETARTLKPGEVVTMEFNGNRLNLDVDASNTVTNVRCG